MADQDQLIQLAVLARRQNIEVTGFRIWLSTDGGDTYENVSETNTFSGFGQAKSEMGPFDDTMYIDLYGIDLDQIVSQSGQAQADDTLLCFQALGHGPAATAEIMSVGEVIPIGNGRFFFDWTGGTGGRARFGTPPVDHAIGYDHYFILRSKLVLISNASFLPGATIQLKLQPYTNLLDYDLASITPISHTVVGRIDIPSPVLSPPSQSFTTSLAISVLTFAGSTVHFTRDNTGADEFSMEWPKSGSVYTTLTITTDTTLRVVAVAADGRISPETIAHYTNSAGGDISAAVLAVFNATQHLQSGLLILSSAGTTIKYKKNGGTTTTYSTPISVASTASGDTIEFWSTTSGKSDSPHGFFDNTYDPPQGGPDPRRLQAP